MPDEGQQSLKQGKFEIDPYSNCLFYDGTPIPLGATEYRVFRTLYVANSAFVHRDQILQTAWGNGNSIVYLSPNNVDQAVKKLRIIFKEYGGRLSILSKRNSGYRLAWPGKDTDRDRFIGVRSRKNPLEDILPTGAVANRIRLTIHLSETEFILFDDAETRLWSYPFPHPLRPPLGFDGWRFRFIPPTGENANLLITARFDDYNTPDSLLFVSQGNLKWSLDAHADLSDYDGSPFSHEWTFTHSTALATAPSEIIWAALAHETKWPGCVLKIDVHGKAAMQFANTGHVEWLHSIAIDGEECLIVCGYNNAYEAPFVALVGSNDPPSRSPDGTRLQYRYANGPSGNVRKYILLPMMQIASRRDAPFSYAKRITQRGNIITVSVAVNTEGTELRYCFTPTLEPLYVYPSEDYYMSPAEFECAPRLSPHGPITSPFLIYWTPRTDWQTYEIDWRENPMR